MTKISKRKIKGTLYDPKVQKIVLGVGVVSLLILSVVWMNGSSVAQHYHQRRSNSLRKAHDPQSVAHGSGAKHVSAPGRHQGDLVQGFQDNIHEDALSIYNNEEDEESGSGSVSRDSADEGSEDNEEVELDDYDSAEGSEDYGEESDLDTQSGDEMMEEEEDEMAQEQ